MKPKQGREADYNTVRRLAMSGTPKAEIARVTGVPPNTVSRWTTDYQKIKQHPYNLDEEVLDDPGNAIHEIELYEKLIVKMRAEGVPDPVIGQNLEKLAKMRKDWENGQIRAGNLLSREAALRIGQTIVQLVCEHFGDHPDFGVRIDHVLAGLASLQPANTRREVRNLRA
ncbi:MAG TPA: hypothetical protein PKC18_16320 [Lacipirellulaceae bacterium]|nr:hypothetical protein [Lacipirellulaceae bacterium]HMP05412.1 hypothetical protein [Lacipirellulaceae bacterium]